MAYALAAVLGCLVGAWLAVVADRLPRHESLVARPRRTPRNIAIVVFAAALAIATVAVRSGAHDIALGLALGAVLIPVAVIDFDFRLIPNRITGPAALAAVVIGLATRPSGVPAQLIAGAAGFAFLLVFALAYPRGMGMGDVKLAGVLGLFLGRSVGVAVMVAVLSGTLVGAAIMARRGVEQGRKTAVPFGPFLALGGVVALLAGTPLVHWYLHSVL